MENKGTIKQQEFISKYNKLHDYLQKLARPYFENVAKGRIEDKYTTQGSAQSFLKNNFIPFMKAVHVLKEENIVLSKRLTDFYKINDLRNVIVHQYNNEEGNYSVVEIAEPTDYSIKLINDTLESLLNPLTIKDYLKLTNKNTIQHLSAADSIYEMFKLINGYQYTQFPVFSDKSIFSGVISDNGIAYWLSQLALQNDQKHGTVELSNATISELLEMDETSQSFRIVHEDDYLYDILNYFEISRETETTPLLLISSHKDIGPSELTPRNLRGILTSYDYLDIYSHAFSKHG